VRTLWVYGSVALTSRILATYRIFPEDPEGGVEFLKKNLTRSKPDWVEIVGIQEEPIAFGLVALIVTLAIPEDPKYSLSALEEWLVSVEGVSEIQEVRVTRSL